MSKEIRIPFEKIQNPQTITSETERIFEEHDLDMHRHEAVEIEDDFAKGERILRVKNTKYFVR